MFLKKQNNTNDGKDPVYWTLVERYRLRLRRVFRPDEEERLLLNALKIRIPEKLSIDLKLKCGTDL